MSDTLTVEHGASRQERNEMRIKRPAWRWPVIGLIVALLIGAFVGFIYLSSSNPLSKEGVFTAADGGFSIRYPASWGEMSESETAKLGGTFSLALSREGPFAFIGVRVEPMEAQESDLGEISRMLDQTMPGQFSDFKKVATTKTTRLASGEKVLQYGFTFLSGEGKQVQEQLTVIPTSKNVYYIGAWTEKKDFGKVQTDLEEIAGSFALQAR